MNKNEILHKEIDLIQAVITRMASNSFLLKGWLISLVAVILTLSKDTIVVEDVSYLSLTLILPVFIFWYLDAFFLHKEKCYRKLYEWVINNRLTSEENLYSLDYTVHKNKVGSVWSIMFTKTLWPFYGFTCLILFLITLFNIYS